MLSDLTEKLLKATESLHRDTCEFEEAGGPSGEVTLAWQDALIAVEKEMGLYEPQGAIVTEGIAEEPRAALMQIKQIVEAQVQQGDNFTMPDDRHRFLLWTIAYLLRDD